MPSGTLGLGITFAVACASALFFLFLRCQGLGRPFGRTSRWWAFSVIGLTSVVSTAVAVASILLLQRLHPAFVGIAAPSGLWLGQIHKRGDERRSRMHDMSTLWLTHLLERMEQGMAEDRLTWCEERVDPDWSIDELIRAAHFYHEYLRERLTTEERRREKINARLQAIDARLDVARRIENGASRSTVTSALRRARVTKETRYSRYLDELGRLAVLLRHDAERDLIRLLGSGYRAGCYRLQKYSPPVRAPFPIDANVQPLRPHP